MGKLGVAGAPAARALNARLRAATRADGAEVAASHRKDAVREAGMPTVHSSPTTTRCRTSPVARAQAAEKALDAGATLKVEMDPS